MIWILLLVALIIAVVGFIIYCKSYDYEAVGIAIISIGIGLAVILSVAALALIFNCMDAAKIEEKIEMYETENAKIEQQMTVIVQKYQEHEQEVFGEVTEKNVMSYITLYHELRSDALVAKQMEIYYANHEKITKMKEQQIMASLYRWWVYFGK